MKIKKSVVGWEEGLRTLPPLAAAPGELMCLRGALGEGEGVGRSEEIEILALGGEVNLECIWRSL